ncbi:MAG TPA: TolC family protein [Pseudomonadales bacterium]|nr:TolC family protein [Pseudomonadales bacterium]
MFSYLTRGSSAAVFACVLSCSMASVAADFTEPHGELTLSAAITAALQRNPLLQTADFEIRVADAKIVQAALHPNPELEATLENFGGSGSMHGTASLESTLALSQVIELGGKRSRRIDVAHFGRDSANIERDTAQLDVLADVTRCYIEIAEQQELLSLTRRATSLAQNTHDTISARVDTGRSPLVEKSRAAIALGRSQLDQQQAERALLAAHHRLAALWGSTEPRFDSVKTDLFDLPPVASFDTLMSRLQESPEFLHYVNESRLREAEWQLAKAEATSDVKIGGGLRHAEDTGDNGIVLNFSMPLPFSNRNQGAIREASLHREQVEVEQQAALINAQTNLFGLYQQLQSARAEVVELRSHLLPQAEASLAQTRDAYDKGRISYLELVDAQRELLELQRASIASAAMYHRIVVEIERLTDQALTANEIK